MTRWSDEKRQQDWSQRTYPAHDSFYRYMRELNRLYLSCPALYEMDYSQEGFSWIDCHQEEHCVYAISRRAKGEKLAAVFNFGMEPQSYSLPKGYSIKRILLHTDWEPYGGSLAVAEEQGPELQLSPFSGVLVEL